jgi:hypothetical protein
VDISKRAKSGLACSDKRTVMFPELLAECELSCSTPFIRLNMPSSLDVTSASMTCADCPGTEKYMFTTGSFREGFNLTGSRGIKNRPKSDKQTNVIMTRMEIKN